MKHLTARTADGSPMAVTVREGNTNQPVIVLIHGWTCRRTYWQPQIDALPPEFPVLAPDLPGHGDTAAPDGSPLSIGTLADDVVRLIQDHANGKVILVGHSMGGAVSLEAAARLGDRVRGVILVDTFVIDYGGLDEETQEGIHKAFRDNFSGAIAGLIEDTSTGATPASLKERLRKEMSEADPEWALPLWKSLLGWNPEQAFQRLRCEVHAINGGLIPDSARERWGGKMTETVLAEGGHFLQMEDPQGFNPHLVEVIRRYA
ncbi:MAG: alpha/beta hydrolase [Ectothiorhodospiraceae bacterium]|nr:alpha/beta hydrolase [Ectothiorhodospiraceae bacterium]